MKRLIAMVVGVALLAGCVYAEAPPWQGSGSSDCNYYTACYMTQFGFADPAKAARVADCESDTPADVNPAGPYVGLFQIWTGHGYSVEQLQDPVFNGQVAAAMVAEQGWGPWPVCGQR